MGGHSGGLHSGTSGARANAGAGSAPAKGTAGNHKASPGLRDHLESAKDAGVVTVFTQYSSDEAERDRTFQTTCPPPLRKAGTHRDRCFSAATTRFRRCTFPSDNRT